MADHAFNPIFAKRYGMTAAVIMHDFAYWIDHNRANGRNYVNGRYWTYNSAKAFQELYPYMSENQIRSAIRKLIDEDLVTKGSFNENKWDHTAWYSITDKGYRVISECYEESEKRSNNGDENDQPIDVLGTDISMCGNPQIDVLENEHRCGVNHESYIDIYNNIPITTDTLPDTYNHLNTNSSSPKEKPHKPDGIPEDFTKFYAAYPRKVAKQMALKAWKALKPNAETVDKIIADVHHRSDTEWRNKEMQYIPHPATYLKQRRWEDETAPTAQSIASGNPNNIYADMDTSGYYSEPF